MTNRYEQRQEARRERLENAADKAANKSNHHHQAARGAVDGIPFGQPILVGHHSEGRHRAAIRRHDSNMRQAVEADRHAQELQRRANAVGTGGISSDDPQAVEKLREQLESAKVSQEVMKKANAILRKKAASDEQKAGELEALGLSQAQAAQILRDGPFPRYALTNNGANMRRIEQRIAELEAMAARQDKEIQGPGYIYREDTEENRVMFVFPGKPDDETRAKMKMEGFKWSPSRDGKPYVRKMTPNALSVARWVREWLDKKAEKDSQKTT